MSKKSRLRMPLDRQHGKRAKKLIQSKQQHLYHIHWLLWKKLSWKKSLLTTCKVLKLFVNTTTADDKYSLFSRDILMQPIQMDSSQKIFFFWIVLGIFQIYTKVWILSKKDESLVYVFRKFWTTKDVVR